MVLAGISVIGITDSYFLYIIETGTLMALRYCNEILKQFVRPYAGGIGQEFILMDVNVHTMHTSLMPIWNTRQSLVWTGLLDHLTRIR